MGSPQIKSAKGSTLPIKVSKRDLAIVRIQASWEQEGGGDRIESWRVRMDEKKEEGTE